MADHPHRLFIGAISGTSVDGLDIALIESGGSIRFRAIRTTPFPDALRRALLSLGQPGNDPVDRLGELDATLGTFIGEAINGFLSQERIPAAAVTAIGSHGQTVRHRPGYEPPFTLQIGDPNRIAEVTGITTVADFRRRDMAAGGQGAPLVPAFHHALFHSPDESRVVLNIGGIANITYLPADGPLRGFDTGPGNGLMDAWCEAHRQAPFDAGGAWAGSGRILPALLQAMLSDPYLSREPPKSTGREAFNLAWLTPYLIPGFRPEDVQRTLLEYTARTIHDAMQRWASPARRVIVCGGGRLNVLLMSRLAELSNIPVVPSEDSGYDGDAVEAAAFAWLAHRRLANEPGNAPGVTGAAGTRVLGAVYAGKMPD